MRMAEHAKIGEIYDYLSAPAAELPDRSNIAFVFGRKSFHLIEAASEAARTADYLVVSGNVGKDSGDLPLRGVPESEYVVKGVLANEAIDPDRIRTETSAVDGIEASIYGLQIMEQDLGYRAIGNLVSVTHPVQTRRLTGILEKQIEKSDLVVTSLTPYATSYQFDPDEPFDQNEAVTEFTRLHKYAQGRSPIVDLPEDFPEYLLEYAQVLEARFAQDFEQQGILNPSTADETIRDQSPVKTILFNTSPEAGLLQRSSDYVDNFMRLARGATRQLILPRLP